MYRTEKELRVEAEGGGDATIGRLQFGTPTLRNAIIARTNPRLVLEIGTPRVPVFVPRNNSSHSQPLRTEENQKLCKGGVGQFYLRTRPTASIPQSPRPALPTPSPNLSSFSPIQNFPPMAPYFLRNLLPKKEKVERARPLWEVLKGLTWIQWGMFFSG